MKDELLLWKERTVLDNPPSEETKLKMFFYERAPLMDAPFGYIFVEEVFLIFIFEYFRYTLDEKSHT
ncbi:hypothetical protein B7492_24775 [Bacillus mycoides]|uniref:Uncharacterized protein n=1 Tax=Bacillus mycoides TaxID=1405 RepID=A0A1W6AEF2_BACMY|nr:hypothetical protein B7492_24775 [Bacillus mycoides]